MNATMLDDFASSLLEVLVPGEVAMLLGPLLTSARLTASATLQSKALRIGV